MADGLNIGRDITKDKLPLTVEDTPDAVSMDEKMSLYFASKWYAAKRRESIKYEAEEKILPILTQAKNYHINVAPGSVFDVD